jgi:hypothetical protein
VASSTLEQAYSSLGANITAAIAQAIRAIEQLLAVFGLNTTPPPSDDSSTISHYLNLLVDSFQDRSAFENSSILLAVTTFLVVAMSWSSRLGNLGRFSPFTRSPPQGSTKVSDADFSYITADDLRKHQAESMNQQQQHPSHDSSADHGPERDTDVLILRNKKKEHAVHFPAYSIAKGELTVGQVRDQAAKKLGAADPRRIKLLYRGKNLKDDSRTCKVEGLRDGAELMLTMAENMGAGSGSESDSGDEFDGIDGQTGGDGEAKRRRNRGKKSKRRKQREEREGVSGTSTPTGNLGVPSSSQQASRTQSPRRPATALEKLAELHEKLQTYMPDCRAFESSPPTDPAKREFEHKRLSETILAQVLLKLDAVETEGDTEARSRRKELVRETQDILHRLDAVMKR